MISLLAILKEGIRNCSKTARVPLAENFPPQQAPQIYLPAQTVFEQTSFMAEHMSEPNRSIED